MSSYDPVPAASDAELLSITITSDLVDKAEVDLEIDDFSIDKNLAQDAVITDGLNTEIDELVIKKIGKGDNAKDVFRIDLSTFDDDFTLEIKSEEEIDTLIIEDVESSNDNGDGTVTVTYLGADGISHSVTIDPDKAQLQLIDAAPPGPAQVEENTIFADDLNLSVVCDTGGSVDLCAFKDSDGKPVDITLTYAFGTTFDQAVDQDGDKRDVQTFGPRPADDEVFLRVVDKDGDPLFEGVVGEGGSFTVDNGGERFGSETHVEIYDFEGGPLIQTIEFHTSCSQPLATNDVFGSIRLDTATLESGTVVTGEGVLTEPDIVYSIEGGPDADLFNVEADTGEVTFKNAPDFEAPLDQGGDNIYDLIVRATSKSNPDCFVDKPVEIQVTDVDDQPICVEENTTAVTDLDLTVECPAPGDVGQDICAFKDSDGKPVSITMTYAFDDVIAQAVDQDSGKAFLETYGPAPADGEVFIVVFDKEDQPLFEGVVGEGEAFTFDNGGERFGSETHVEIFDSEGGALLQKIEFHTSCSQPLAIGDQFGSITLDQTTLESGTTVGAPVLATVGEGEIVYEIAGGADAALFDVDAATGEVSFISPPDFEAPGDAGGDNIYDVIVRATSIADPDCSVEKPLQIEVKNQAEFGTVAGRVFADEDADGLQDAAPADPGLPDVTVELVEAQTGNVVALQITDPNGIYSFDSVPEGDYRVQFTAPPGQEFTEQDVGQDDTIDSDAGPDGLTDVIEVVGGDQVIVDAGLKADAPLGSVIAIDDTYFVNYEDFVPDGDGLVVTFDGAPADSILFNDSDPEGDDFAISAVGADSDGGDGFSAAGDSFGTFDVAASGFFSFRLSADDIATEFNNGVFLVDKVAAVSYEIEDDSPSMATSLALITIFVSPPGDIDD